MGRSARRNCDLRETDHLGLSFQWGNVLSLSLSLSRLLSPQASSLSHFPVGPRPRPPAHVLLELRMSARGDDDGDEDVAGQGDKGNAPSAVGKAVKELLYTNVRANTRITYNYRITEVHTTTTHGTDRARGAPLRACVNFPCGAGSGAGAGCGCGQGDAGARADLAESREGRNLAR
jgi:hypothetical protein